MAQLSPFALFGLKPSFAIDENKLESAYQAAMLKVHPDRFAGRPAAERRVAEQWSARINEDYQLLKNNVRRAAWLCENAGHPIEAETNTAMPAGFLMTQMAWREALEAAGSDEAKIAAVRERAQNEADTTVAELTAAIDGTKDWDRAVTLTRSLMFIERFLEEARKAAKH